MTRTTLTATNHDDLRQYQSDLKSEVSQLFWCSTSTPAATPVIQIDGHARLLANCQHTVLTIQAMPFSTAQAMQHPRFLQRLSFALCSTGGLIGRFAGASQS